MADVTIDVRGLSCPRPMVETKKALKRMDPGKTLEVIGDHGPSKREVPEMASEQGNEVLDVTEEGGVWHVVIRKGGE